MNIVQVIKADLSNHAIYKIIKKLFLRGIKKKHEW